MGTVVQGIWYGLTETGLMRRSDCSSGSSSRRAWWAWRQCGYVSGFSQQQRQVAEELGTSSLKRRLLAWVSGMQGPGIGSEQTY